MEKNGFAALLDDLQYIVFVYDEDGDVISKAGFTVFKDAAIYYNSWLTVARDVEMWCNDNGTPCCL